MASIFIFLTGTFQMYSQVYNLDLFPGSYPATHYQYSAFLFPASLSLPTDLVIQVETLSIIE